MAHNHPSMYSSAPSQVGRLPRRGGGGVLPPAANAYAPAKAGSTQTWASLSLQQFANAIGKLSCPQLLALVQNLSLSAAKRNRARDMYAQKCGMKQYKKVAGGYGLDYGMDDAAEDDVAGRFGLSEAQYDPAIDDAYPGRVSGGFGLSGSGTSDPAIDNPFPMEMLLSSAVPFHGQSVVVTEAHYAATSSRAAYLQAVNQLDQAAQNASTQGELSAIDQIATGIEAAKTIRNISASPASVAAVTAGAQQGDPAATAVAAAIGLAKVSDMKAAASSLATGMQQGDASALKTAQALAQAAASPGPQQVQAKVAVAMVSSCCDSCKAASRPQIKGLGGNDYRVPACSTRPTHSGPGFIMQSPGLPLGQPGLSAQGPLAYQPGPRQAPQRGGQQTAQTYVPPTIF